MAFQTPAWFQDRTDHVWYQTDPGVPGLVPARWKCCLCGAIAHSTPPRYPTPKDWVCREYQLPLSQEEKQMCPRPEIQRL